MGDMYRYGAYRADITTPNHSMHEKIYNFLTIASS